MMSEVIDTPVIKECIENIDGIHSKDINNIQLDSINNKINYNEIINNLSNLFVDINSKKKIIKKNKNSITGVSIKSLSLDKINNSQE